MIIVKIIPGWIFTLCGGLSFIYLVMGLRQYCSRIQNSIQIPFNKLIYSYAIVTFIAVIDEIFGLSDIESECGFAILALIIVGYFTYIFVIVGVRLRNVLSSHKSVGLRFILCPIIGVLFAIVSGMLSDNDKWYTLGGNLAYIYLLYSLMNFFRANIGEN